MNVKEITIDRKKIVNAIPSSGRVQFVDHERPADECFAASDILKQISDALAAGTRVLLVTIRDCEGGNIEAGDAVYQALRAFAANPARRVVVHVSGFAASTAAHIALAGDYLFVDLDAKFYLHGAIVRWPGDPEGEERARIAANARTKAVVLERSAMPPRAVDDAMACGYDPSAELPYKAKTLLPDVAIGWRWADQIADLDSARALAAFLAIGGDYATPRTVMLRERASWPAVECSLDASKITAGALATSNYAEDASANPTAGAKLDHTGTALKVAPANFQVGSTLIRDVWFGKVRPMLIREFGHRTATGWQGAQGAGTNATEYLAAGAWDATNKRIRLLGKNMVALGFNEMRLSGAVLNGTYPVPNAHSYEIVVFYNGAAGGDLFIDLELWETLYDASIPAMVRRKVDWNASDGPLFDLSAIFYNSQGTWVGYW